MSPQIVCNPCLGQTNIVSGDTVQITVLFSTHPENQSLTDVVVWHDNSEIQEWTSLNLIQVANDVQTLSAKPQDSVQRKCFQGSLFKLARKNVIRFTIKFRHGAGEWVWANDQLSMGDAEVVFSNDGPIPEPLSYYFQEVSLDGESSRPRVRNFLDDETSIEGTEDTRAWSIKSSIKAATEKESSYRHTKLGKPTGVLRWFCIARESVPWFCPRQGKGSFAAKEDAILASFLREDGLHVVILAVSLDDVLTVLKSDENGCLIAVARNDKTVENASVVLVAVGRMFETANEVLWNHARSIVERKKGQVVKNTVSKPENVNQTSLASWYDGFAYCTWNGLGQQLTEEKIFKALETLSEAGIQFSTLIIDDNWQSLDKHGENNFHHRWMEFEADRDAFPYGLKHTIAHIRKQQPEIKHIAVWHGVFGYWNGLSPEGAITNSYQTKLLRKSGKGFLGEGSLIAVNPADVERFYDDFYRFLSDCGIDSVKIDTQFLLDQIDDAADRATYISAYQDAWIMASQRHFSSRAISCMSQTPQIVFRSQLVKSLPTLMVRNSEDFFPDGPDSHPWHIFCNAHNNVLTQHLNVLPDWDMFQTSHEYSTFHGAARCISGGPIYFTDKPGEHDVGLIKEMTAKTPAGETIILRPNVGKTINAYSSNNEKKLLKIGTTTIETKTSMLGIFNINYCPISELVDLEDFPGFQHSRGQKYVVRAHRSGVLSMAIDPHDSTTSHLLVELDVKGSEILTLYPLEEITVEKEDFVANFAVLGLLDKMTGAAAVVETRVQRVEGGSNIHVTLKALGVLGIYLPTSAIAINPISTPPEIKICDLQIPSDAIEYIPSFEILKIDLERGWDSQTSKSLHNHSKKLVDIEIFLKSE